MSELVKEWKEKNINYAEFNFSCGGDSMNETDLHFFDENDDLVDVSETLSSELDRLVYHNVQFYEASDGHYLGESGKVIIQLDEENEFCFSKSAQSEWSENVTQRFNVILTEEEKKFIEENILSIGHSNWDGDFVNYKKDMFLSSEKTTMLETIKEKLYDNAQKIYKIYEGDDYNGDSLTYTTNDEDEDVDKTHFIVDENGNDCLVLSVSLDIYTYTDSE